MDAKTIQSLTTHEASIFAVLAEGGKYSVADMTIRTHFCDPRSTIAAIRRKGIQIKDEWKKSRNGRYKVYFL